MKKKIVPFLDIAYITAVFVLLFSPFLHESRDFIYNKYQFVPFETINRYLYFYNLRHSSNILLQLLGNVAIMLPLPPLLYATFRKMPFFAVAAVSILLTATIEPIQYIIDSRMNTYRFVVDVDDTILNELGIIISLVFVGIFDIIYHKMKRGKI
ncbi:hypothetical protein AGMMS49975_09780 [Clostridia bacterium]|nr:hypothetical protein AGMMS49975_09780 [Clostridia bacterium]